jgi:hypothetical protein
MQGIEGGLSSLGCSVNAFYSLSSVMAFTPIFAEARRGVKRLEKVKASRSCRKRGPFGPGSTWPLDISCVSYNLMSVSKHILIALHVLGLFSSRILVDLQDFHSLTFMS